MSGLEIALLVFGLACVIISFFIVDNNDRVEKGSAPAPDTKAFTELSKKVIADTNNNAEKVLNETEEKLEALSNDKIMAVGEYSDQVIEKIDTNHKEVVFLYQMLKEKEEELKSTAQELENVRIECEKLIRENKELEQGTSKAANAGYSREDVISNDSSDATAANATADMTSAANAGNVLSQTKRSNEKKAAAGKSANKKNAAKVTANSKSVLNNDSSERQYGWGEALALAEEQQDEMDSISERNKEIIELYKKKKSVLEISKLLGMGQGEVKLVIDLYCK